MANGRAAVPAPGLMDPDPKECFVAPGLATGAGGAPPGPPREGPRRANIPYDLQIANLSPDSEHSVLKGTHTKSKQQARVEYSKGTLFYSKKLVAPSQSTTHLPRVELIPKVSTKLLVRPSPFPSALIQRGDSWPPFPRVELTQKVSTNN